MLLGVFIVYFVDLIEINKNVYESKLPRSLLWGTGGAQGSKIVKNSLK